MNKPSDDYIILITEIDDILVVFFLQTLLKNYEADIETLNKQQKQQVERAEVAQGLDMKFASKRIRQDQEKELKLFREGMRQEMKLLKQEVDMLPKDVRKDTMRRKKEEKEIDQGEKVGVDALTLPIMSATFVQNTRTQRFVKNI